MLCDQCEENINHLLVACPESRQLWWMALRAVGQTACMPLSEASFHQWLCNSRKNIDKAQRHGFDTIAALVAWAIWKERNNRVFNNHQRSWAQVAKAMAAEAELWRLARTAVPVLHLPESFLVAPSFARLGFFLFFFAASCFLSPSIFLFQCK